MKKILVLGLIMGGLFPSTLNAGCIMPICPSEPVVCPQNKFMGDDGTCYDCNDKRRISVNCIGGKRAVEKICPNRKNGSCGISVLECSPNEDLVENECILKCNKGFVRNEQGVCCNTNGECFVELW